MYVPCAGWAGKLGRYLLVRVLVVSPQPLLRHTSSKVHAYLDARTYEYYIVLATFKIIPAVQHAPILVLPM